MKDYFSWLLTDTLTQTQPIFDWKTEPRPPAYTQIELNSGPKAIQVNSQGWLSKASKACLRFSRFQSPVIDIATIMIYPTASPDLLPVFAVEWVAVMDKIHVLVLDVALLNKEVPFANEALGQLKNKWAAIFPTQAEKPAWFAAIESPYAIFSKAGIQQMEALKELLNDYLKATTACYYQPHFAQSQGGKDHALVAAYKKHHALHSPAKTIIKKENKAWLDTFLHQYHFGIIT